MTRQPATGRGAPGTGAWSETHRLLRAVPAQELAAPDLERLAVASYLIGEDGDALAAWEQAHRRHLDAGEPAEAARCGFWSAFCLMMQGQMAHAGGWLHRTQQIVDDLECAATGYVKIPVALESLGSGDARTALDLAVEARTIGQRFDDRDLRAFGMLGHGQALLALGEEAAGLAILDEVMLSVSAGEVGPITSGIVYCAVILECMQIFDLARATEWTAALDAWCAAQPDLVPYRGQCLVHQSQLQQAAGDWPRAASTVASACERLTDPPHPALGLACYQEAELHRLRGALAVAEEAYARASRAGYHPMPGLALLELARGDPGTAAASIRRALIEAHQAYQRPPLLAAAVEILVAGGELDAAGDAARELASIAAPSTSAVLGAMAEHAVGEVALASGDPATALTHLRAAAEVWWRLQLPYEGARTGALLGRACLALGDRAAAALELDRAREVFASLGAAGELERLVPPAGGGAGSKGGLSARELEVLAHVAEGRTNREIGERLSISPHTVGRHLENVYAKLGVSSRAAAIAHAYEHGLL